MKWFLGIFAFFIWGVILHFIFDAEHSLDHFYLAILAFLTILFATLTIVLSIITFKTIRNYFQQKVKHLKAKEREFLQYSFFAIVAALIAKIASINGRISVFELEGARQAFKRIGIKETIEQRFCFKVFQLVKHNKITLEEYVDILVRYTRHESTRILVYEILWDIAMADGKLSSLEENILKTILSHLKLPEFLFTKFYNARCQYNKKDYESNNTQEEKWSKASHGADARNFCNGEITLSKAYLILECKPEDSNEMIKKAYRNLAKRYHPDLLRQDNAPEFMIKKANEMMALINAAWEYIKKYRGIR